MRVCKCIVPLRHAGALNRRRRKSSREAGGREREMAKDRLFPRRKKEPHLTRNSNPNPIGYKPRVIATILAGRFRT
ncbi:hypothetical protein TNCV_3772881 [Trichonephila clavipes]|nr:hypothetical protein TNCV_3772881 [Trichonephila clavipes]